MLEVVGGDQNSSVLEDQLDVLLSNCFMSYTVKLLLRII